jgi:ATP-dependent DNA helicase RecQ
VSSAPSASRPRSNREAPSPTALGWARKPTPSIHYQTPGSVVAYYQQVGRAGRALDAAYGVLLSGREETDITDYFIEGAFPTRGEVEQVIQALEAASDGLSVPELLTRLNVSKGRIEKTLVLLSLESPAPIVKQGSKWQLTAATLGETFWQRADRLTSLRREEQREMQEYVRLESRHMEFLIRALDGEPAEIESSALPPLPTTVDPALAREAVAFLRRTSLPLESRKQWPAGGLPKLGVNGRIPAERQAQPGRVLCVWGDAGWGDAVRHGKYREHHFSDELVSASAALVREWNPSPSRPG